MNPKHAHYVAVTGVVVKDGKFLITKRAANEDFFADKWTIPGGKIETSDYINRPTKTEKQWYNVFEDALRREIMEEVGLLISNIKYLTNLTFIRKDNVPVVVVSLYADHMEGSVKLSSELSEYAWVDINEARNYNFIEGIYEELVLLDKVLKKENL